MVNKYNIADFRDKVDWEGGLYEAIAGYGLDEKNLDQNVDPEFVQLIKDFAEGARKLSFIEDTINQWFDELDEE